MAEPPSKRVAAAGGGDRLSALPDDLLHSITSLLMARQVVQTSVLSRRWRDLWRSTPCLDIDHGEIGRGKLLGFTSNLFKKHSAPLLERFRLHLGGASFTSHAAAADMVRRGFGYRPAALEITMPDYFWLDLPPVAPATACRLTRMRLGGVRLDGSFAELLRSACPVLGDLALTGCKCVFQEMASPSLRSLSIDCCSSDSVPRTVTAPALASFRLIFLKNKARQEALLLVNGAAGGSSPLHASITVSCEDFGFAGSMFTLLGSLRSVRTLELWGFSYQTLMNGKETFPKLHNLTTLLMGKCEMSKQFDILRLFLKNVPSLEKITLKHCKYSTEYTKKYAQRKVAPRFWKLLCYDHDDMKLIGIKYKDTNTSNLFGLLMGIRAKLEENTVILTKD